MGVFDFLVRKQRHIEALFSEYLDEWAAGLREFRKAMVIYLEAGPGEDLAYAVEQTHRRESQADDLRRTIQYQMYVKALLPESRNDILGLLESIDRVLNGAEATLFIIVNEGVVMPQRFTEEFGNLVDKTLNSAEMLHQIARKVFVPNPDLPSTVRAIDEKESECDRIERDLIRRTFQTGKMKTLHKILLRDLINKVGDISDHAQRVANRIQIISVKRRV